MEPVLKEMKAQPRKAGEPMKFDTKGDITVAGVTKPLDMVVTLTPQGNKLKVTGIGYKEHVQPAGFEMPNRNGNADPSAMMSALDKDLGNIKLEIDDKLLSNVTVTSTKRLLQLGIDRKVFNVDKNLTSAMESVKISPTVCGFIWPLAIDPLIVSVFLLSMK